MKLQFYINLNWNLKTAFYLCKHWLPHASPYKHLECDGLIFHKLIYLYSFFVQIINSSLRFIYRNVLNPCLLMTVHKIFLHIKAYFFFLTFINSVHKHWPSSNIDPVTSSNVAYLRQRTDACWGIMDYLHKPFTESVKLIKSLDRNKQIGNRPHF